MKMAFYMYKCRKCGKVFESGEAVPEKVAKLHLYYSLFGGDPVSAVRDLTPISLLSVHDSCSRQIESVGVADLIGYEVGDK